MYCDIWSTQLLLLSAFVNVMWIFHKCSNVCVVSGSFEVKDLDDSSDSENDSTGFVSGQDLCLPALRYLRQCCDIIASMCCMPACPVFTGAHRYSTTTDWPLYLLSVLRMYLWLHVFLAIVTTWNHWDFVQYSYEGVTGPFKTKLVVSRVFFAIITVKRPV